MLRTVSYVLTVLAGVASLPFLFRHLGVVASGRYATVMSIAAIVHGVIEVGLSPISVREYSLASADARGRLMRDLLGLRMAAVALVSGAAAAIMVLSGYPTVLVAGASIAMGGVLFESMSSVYGVWLSTTLQLGRLALMQLVRQVVAVVCTVGLVIIGAPLVWFFVLLTVAGAFQLLTSLVTTRRAIPHRPSFDTAAWWRIVRRSAPYIVAMTLGVIYVRVAMVLMPVVGSARETGYFGVPFRLLEIVTVVAALIMSSAFPILARSAQRDAARHRYALRRLLEVSLLVGAWVALVALTGAGFVVEVLAGPGFAPSVDVLRILAFSLAAQFLIAAWAFALLSVEVYLDVLVANAVAVAVAVALTLVAVPWMGAAGGAAATAAADATLLAGYGWALRRSVPGSGISPRVLGTVGLAFAVASAAALLAPLPDAARIVLASALYVTIAYAGRAVPPELAALLPGHRPSPPDGEDPAASRPLAAHVAAPSADAVQETGEPVPAVAPAPAPAPVRPVPVPEPEPEPPALAPRRLTAVRDSPHTR